MNYMEHYKNVGDLMTLVGDFPLLEGELTRQENGFRFVNDTVEITAAFEEHPSGVTVRRDSVKNLSNRPITIRTILSKFVFNSGEFEVYTQYNENNWEGQEGWQKLVTEIAAHGKELRCSFENAPFMALRNTGSGRGVAFHIFENCLWLLRARKDMCQPGQVKTVTVEAGVANDNFSLCLAPGEVFALPAIGLYTFRNRTDMDAWKLHRYCNHQFMDKPLPVIYNSWMSKFDDISYELLSQQVAVAQRLGMEYFVIDAGWFGEPFQWHTSVGDWAEYPNAGMAGRMGEFADLVRARGMKFGLWFEIERADPQSRAYKAHPEYYIMEKNRAFLDFANPDARAFAFDAVAENVRKYGIEYIKFDFNATCTFDIRGLAFLPYFAGYDAFIRRVKEAFPGIYLEGCASGGMRIAPATLRWFDSYWLSDQQNLHRQMDIYKTVVKRMPNRALSTWITVQSLKDFGPCAKGGTEDRIFTGDGAWLHAERTTEPYILAAMLGGPVGISCDLTMLTEDLLQKLEQGIRQFKEERTFWNVSECRILADNDFLTVLQYNDPDFEKIKIQIFTRQFRQNAVTVYPVCASGARYVLDDGSVRAADRLEELGIERPVERRYLYSATCIELTRQKEK